MTNTTAPIASRTSDMGQTTYLLALTRYGTSGWQFTKQVNDGPAWTMRTNKAGRGLWRITESGEKQIYGTSQYSLPAGRGLAICKLVK